MEAGGNVVNREAIVQVSVVMCAGAVEERRMGIRSVPAAVHISTDAALSPAFWRILPVVVEWLPCNRR